MKNSLYEIGPRHTGVERFFLITAPFALILALWLGPMLRPDVPPSHVVVRPPWTDAERQERLRLKAEEFEEKMRALRALHDAHASFK